MKTEISRTFLHSQVFHSRRLLRQPAPLNTRMLHHAETALKREQDLSDEPGYPSIDFAPKSKHYDGERRLPVEQSFSLVS